MCYIQSCGWRWRRGISCLMKYFTLEPLALLIIARTGVTLPVSDGTIRRTTTQQLNK